MERGTSQPILKAQHDSPAFTRLKPPHASQVPVEETRYGVPLLTDPPTRRCRRWSTR